MTSRGHVEAGAGRWAVFLDRDGVINRRVVGDYVRDPSQLVLLEGVLDAIALLAARAPHIVVVTNQQAIGKGLMTTRSLARVNDQIMEDVVAAGGRIDEVVWCPHLASDSCDCRKPRPGLVLAWLARHPEVDPGSCFMIGDSPGDMEMARRAGIGTAVWVDDGSQPEPATYDVRVPSLRAFALRAFDGRSLGQEKAS